MSDRQPDDQGQPAGDQPSWSTPGGDPPRESSEDWSTLPPSFRQPASDLPPAPTYGGGHGYYPGQPFTGAAMVNKPKSNLVSAILVTLFCCLPFGIVSIVYAAQVDSKWNAGDWRGAEQSSRLAKNWGLAGLVSGILFSIFYVLVVIGSGGSSSGRY